VSLENVINNTLCISNNYFGKNNINEVIGGSYTPTKVIWNAYTKYLYSPVVFIAKNVDVTFFNCN